MTRIVRPVPSIALVAVFVLWGSRALLAVSPAPAAPVGTPAAPEQDAKETTDAPAKSEAQDATDNERSLRVKPRATRTSKTAKGTNSERGKEPASGAKGAPRARRGGAAGSAAEALVSRAQEATAAGRFAEARDLLDGVDRTRLSDEKADEAGYLSALLTEEGVKQGGEFTAYLKEFPKGKHRREATLALARLHYVQGDYAEADGLLAIFSPGVEHDRIGREGLVLRGLSELARGDAPGALQFLLSCDKDLKGSTEEEAYYFATSQAGLRSGKPQAAVDALRVLLDRHAQGSYAPQALYAMGMALEQMGRASDATNVFRQVAQRFPDSYEATRVRDRGIRPGSNAGSGLPIGGGYALQIGAFSRRDLADALARDVRLAGTPDVSVKQGNESPPIYRVRAGAFATRDEARALGERLRRERGFSYNVVPH
jgi:septal ring-binding cell division protein DamX